MTTAIIGAGPAGIMAAATIIESKPETHVILIDKNAKLGRKVLLTGGGRCNLTTGIRDIRQLLTRYPRGGKFLQTAMRKFGPEDVYNWFENHHVPLKTENDLRVFPQSDNGKDVVEIFEKIFMHADIELLLNQSVVDIKKQNANFSVKLDTGKNILVNKIIIATGGNTYTQTGSTGDGFTFARSLGHTITDLSTSLHSFQLAEDWTKDLSGVSLEKVTLQISDNKKLATTGPVVFTHQGLSGPAAFALSSLIAFEKYDEKNQLRLYIDFAPDQSEDQLVGAFIKATNAQSKQFFWKTTQQWVPKSIALSLLVLAEIDLQSQNAQVGKKQQRQIVNLLKKLPVSIVGKGPGSEFVTAGGVELSEINPNTMESKICPGLFFAGEVLNVDAFTGGFNLQAAWATGHLAGESSIAEII